MRASALSLSLRFTANPHSLVRPVPMCTPAVRLCAHARLYSLEYLQLRLPRRPPPSPAVVPRRRHPPRRRRTRAGRRGSVGQPRRIRCGAGAQHAARRRVYDTHRIVCVSLPSGGYARCLRHMPHRGNAAAATTFPLPLLPTSLLPISLPSSLPPPPPPRPSPCP